MTDKTQVQEARFSLSSSLHKCEKAREKLKEGTAQRSWLEVQIEALDCALKLLSEEHTEAFDPQTLIKTKKTLEKLSDIVAKVENKYVTQSAQKTLAQRRLASYRLVMQIIEEKLKDD